MSHITGRFTPFAGCCGLDILYGLASTGRSSPTNGSGNAAVAVTNDRQRQYGDHAALEKSGFKMVATFAGRYSRNKLYLWLRDRAPPKPVHVPQRSGRFISRRTGRPVTDRWALHNPSRVKQV
jgi:hypothetical protein